MYFAFLGYYTYFLIPPALLGLLMNFYVSDSNRELSIMLFSVFNLVWATIFLESWKRKTAELAYRWGTINTEQFEEPRAMFYGELETDLVTGRLQPQYSSFRRLVKFYCVSVPVMMVALVVAWLVMLLYFYLEDYVKPLYQGDETMYGTFLSLLPTIVYAFIVLILNAIYQPLAVALNNWGNGNFDILGHEKPRIVNTGCPVVMECHRKSRNLGRPFSRPGKSWKIAKVMESHGK